MRTHVETTIRTHLQANDAVQETIDWTEIVARIANDPSPLPPRRPARFGVWVAVAAAVLTILVVGLIPVLTRSDSPPPADTVVPTTLPVNVVPTTAIDVSTPTTVPIEPNVGTATLTWRKTELDVDGVFGVHGGGDRFVLSHGGISTSSDGLEWTHLSIDGFNEGSDIRAWEDVVLIVSGGGGWSREEDGPFFSIPSKVSIVNPDGSVNQQVFNGEVLTAAVGAGGMIVNIDPNSSYGAVVDAVLGEAFSGSLYETDTRQGVLYVETMDGRTAQIVLADHGIEETEIVSSWYSEDGVEWVPLPDLPGGIDVVGISNGFVGVVGSEAWHSVDGQTWDNLGDIGFTPDPWESSSAPMRWREGVIATNGSHYVYLSADGVVPIPDPPVQLTSLNEAPWPLYLAGDLGIVIVNADENQLLHSPDGIEWIVSGLPPEMKDSWGWSTSTAAMTDEAVLLLLWEDTGDGQLPVTWLGTLP